LTITDALRRVAARAKQRIRPDGAADSLAETHAVRRALADTYLEGDGIEIGALHQPLQLPQAARVKYVDRMSAPELRRHYEELAGVSLVEVDIIDDGESLATVASSSQDFVIANHFLEHCQNPLATLKALERVLKEDGVIYMAVPDKRFTFDVDRPCTSLAHVMRDFEEGPEWSRRGHFEEWARLVNKVNGEKAVEDEINRLMAVDYSIHYHVWRAHDLLELMTAAQRLTSLEIELFRRNGFENVVILRKPMSK